MQATCNETGLLTEHQVVEVILTSDMACVSALLRLYERQTEDEQRAEVTSHSNGIGFNAFDAEILTSLAKQAAEHRARRAAGTRYQNLPDLSDKQMELVRKKLVRYRRQLYAIYLEMNAAPKEEETPSGAEGPPAEPWPAHCPICEVPLVPGAGCEMCAAYDRWLAEQYEMAAAGG